MKIPISRIVGNPWQTRIGEPDPEYIKELALDISRNGLLQPPVGRLFNGDWAVPVEQFELSVWDMKLHEGNNLVVQLAFGHNRLAAYKWLDLDNDTAGDYSQMPVEIRNLTDEQMAVMAWSENENRKDVTPIERAKSIEKRMADFGWNQHEVADKLGVARPTVSNILRLLKLPENVQFLVNAGKISARAASALLPMYELPEETRKLAQNEWYARPSQILDHAIEGQSSDLIRKDVDRLYETYTRPLQKAEFGLNELFPEGLMVNGYDFEGDQCKVYCGLCRTCDRRLKDQGNVCLDIGCYKAKETLHRRAYLARASDKCGIPVVDPNKGGRVTFFPSYHNEDTAEKIIKSKCENLRLVYVQIADGEARVDGHPHAQIVCDKRNDSCTCLKGLSIAARQAVPAKAVDQAIQAEKELDPDYEGEDDQVEEESEAEVCAQTGTAPDPKELEELARQARKAKMDVSRHVEAAAKKVTNLLVEGFRNNQPGAYYLVAHHYAYPGSRELVLENIYQKLARNVVSLIVPDGANNVDELYEIINRKLANLELDAVYPYETLVEVLGGEDEG